jgi:hypothetical protein
MAVNPTDDNVISYQGNMRLSLSLSLPLKISSCASTIFDYLGRHSTSMPPATTILSHLLPSFLPPTPDARQVRHPDCSDPNRKHQIHKIHSTPLPQLQPSLRLQTHEHRRNKRDINSQRSRLNDPPHLWVWTSAQKYCVHGAHEGVQDTSLMQQCCLFGNENGHVCWHDEFEGASRIGEASEGCANEREGVNPSKPYAVEGVEVWLGHCVGLGSRLPSSSR